MKGFFCFFAVCGRMDFCNKLSGLVIAHRGISLNKCGDAFKYRGFADIKKYRDLCRLKTKTDGKTMKLV